MPVVVVSDQASTDFKLLTVRRPTSADGSELESGADRISYAIFKLDGSEKVVVTESLGCSPLFKNSEISAEADNFRRAVFPQFVKKLTSSIEPRFAAIDFFYTLKYGRPESKVLIIRWVPDSASVKLKMAYVQADGTMKATLSASKVFQFNHESELSYQALADFASKP